MRKQCKSLLSWALAAAMTAGLLPAPVAYAADTANIKTVMLGTAGIQDPADYDSKGNRAPQSYIYFGKNSANNANPIQWRVLDKDTTSTDEEGIFLLSELALESVPFNEEIHYHNNDGGWHRGQGSGSQTCVCQEPLANIWEGSDAERWCADFVDPQKKNNFTQAENAAMLTTSRTETGTVTGKTFFGQSIWLDSKRENDKAFFLSVKELSDYVSNAQRTSSLLPQRDSSSGGNVYWWLISPDADDEIYAGVVDTTAWVYVAGVLPSADEWARPALNLDLDSVLFTSAAVGGKSASGMDTGLKAVSDYEANNTGAREWKLTILDDNRKFAISDVEIQGDSVGFSYADAETGDKEYISAIIMENGEITYYGRILQLDGTTNGASGTASLPLPDGVTLGSETELYVFNEQYNGGASDNTKLSDYGSALKKITNPTVDNTAPTLEPGDAFRTSETAATVTFTSDKAGQYYYSVVEKDAEAPTINTSGTGTACDTSEQTISIDNLDGVGAKDIYIKVKDAAGNVSDALKMDIPAYVPSAQKYMLTVELNGGNGEDKSGQYQAGTKIEIYAGTKAGYDFTGWISSNGGTFANASAAKTDFTMPNAPTTITATWRDQSAPPAPDPAPGDDWTPAPPTPSTYPPVINQTDGGTVTVNPSAPRRGDEVTITATPDAGKRVTFVGVTDRNGNVIPVTDNGNGTWSFTHPNSIVTVGVVFRDVVEPWRNPFGDVQESDWYYEAVKYVSENDLMNGTSATTFTPNGASTRAMLWAILARMDGASVAGADWMAQAGAWATGAGVSDGTNPSGALTREQLVTMLHRAAGSPEPRGDLSAFADADSVSEYAQVPLAWATENGIVSGMGGNRLDPQGGATRAQLAAMLQRYNG